MTAPRNDRQDAPRNSPGAEAPRAALDLRPALAEDAEALAALIRRAFVHQAPTVPPPSALRETAESVAAQLRAGGGAVALAEGEAVGAVLWKPRDGALGLGRLAVDPDWRRRGVARALLAEAEAEARRLGLDRLRLSTRLSLLDNRRLFAAAGYREVSFECHEGFSEPTFVDMERRLA